MESRSARGRRGGLTRWIRSRPAPDGNARLVRALQPRRSAAPAAPVKGDLHLGGQFHAGLTSGWKGTGRAEACEPPRRLLVATKGTDQPDEEVIEAMLTADRDQTILVIEARGLPIEHPAAHGAGWQVHAEDLAAHLAGRERCDIKAR
jgi:hypothetical protein